LVVVVVPWWWWWCLSDYMFTSLDCSRLDARTASIKTTPPSIRPPDPSSPNPNPQPHPTGLGPLVPGSSDISQLALLHAYLGAISPAQWPGVAALPDWGKVRFEQEGAGVGAAALLPDAPDDALDLLRQLLRCGWGRLLVGVGGHPAIQRCGGAPLLSRDAQL